MKTENIVVQKQSWCYWYKIQWIVRLSLIFYDRPMTDGPTSSLHNELLKEIIDLVAVSAVEADRRRCGHRASGRRSIPVHSPGRCDNPPEGHR